MRHLSIRLSVFCLTAIGFSSNHAAPADCAVLLEKASQTELSLPSHQFDQDDKSGWRALDAAGCTAEAATLVERYLIGYESNLRGLKWHHAQLLALTGRYAEAIGTARQAINPVENEQHPKFKWNAYVLATIAFLEKDSGALHRQIKIIESALPEEPMNKSNLEIASGLAQCLAMPYKQAYGCRGAP